LGQQVDGLLGLEIVELGAKRVLQPGGERSGLGFLQRGKQQTFQVVVGDVEHALEIFRRRGKKFGLVKEPAVAR
jgi:hypothetical protein